MSKLNDMKRAPSTWISIALLAGIGGYFALRPNEQPPLPSPIRVDATTTTTDPTDQLFVDDGDLDGPLGSIQPNIRPLSLNEWPVIDERLGAGGAGDQPHVATDTGQPLRRAPIHMVHFDNPALPTPTLDARKRECIAYPLTASFSRVRYNLLLQPNMYEVARRNWSDPKWLETFRVDGGTFPVNLWRVRAGVAVFWKVVRVQAGPGLPTGNPQVGLSAEFFRGGDEVCVETPRSCPALFIAYDQQTGLVVQPQLSAIQNSSNDSTPIPGAWMVIGGEAR